MACLNDLKENDIVLTKQTFHFARLKKELGFKDFIKIKKGSLLLVIENNFGATFKDRFVCCLIDNRKIYINFSYENKSNSEDSFEILNN